MPDADTNGIHDLLFDTKDYARRIHWWVRLFGVVWLITVAISVVFGVYVGARLSVDRSNSTSLTNYTACIANGYSAAYCLQNN